MNDKIEQLIEWYRAQVSGEIRLFKGQENEMTLDNIWHKINHYSQLRKNLSQGTLKTQHKHQIERAYYYNVECWPLERIANH